MKYDNETLDAIIHQLLHGNKHFKWLMIMAAITAAAAKAKGLW